MALQITEWSCPAELLRTCLVVEHRAPRLWVQVVALELRCIQGVEQRLLMDRYVKSENCGPRVAVIVTCYNQAEIVGDALQSIARQTYANWQCVVVDDGSTDDTALAVQPFLSDPRFVYIRKENGGVCSARNLGIRKSSSELILPLDGDDRIHRDYLRLAASYFVAHPDTDLVYPLVRFFGQRRGVWRLPTYSYERLRFQNMIVVSSVFKRTLLNGTVGYADNMKNGYADWDLYLRILDDKSKVHRIERALFFYRIQKWSMTVELDGHVDKKNELLQLIYLNNAEKYADVVRNPVTSFHAIFELFRRDVAARYRRQRIGWQVVSGILFVGLVILFLLT